MTNSGKLFHTRGPATVNGVKARSPSDERRVAGTTRADDDADRSRRRDVTLLQQQAYLLLKYLMCTGIGFPVGLGTKSKSSFHGNGDDLCGIGNAEKI